MEACEFAITKGQANVNISDKPSEVSKELLKMSRVEIVKLDQKIMSNLLQHHISVPCEYLIT
jgi:hypothetical protein